MRLPSDFSILPGAEARYLPPVALAEEENRTGLFVNHHDASRDKQEKLRGWRSCLLARQAQ